mmetsp:Transcript_22429/g.62185  ORF Transcript_22429/g.62185 Transcript_22429/m.62185 type:complete len:293 (-) Transcript_22429:665-1543(-)
MDCTTLLMAVIPGSACRHTFPREGHLLSDQCKRDPFPSRLMPISPEPPVCMVPCSEQSPPPTPLQPAHSDRRVGSCFAWMFPVSTGGSRGSCRCWPLLPRLPLAPLHHRPPASQSTGLRPRQWLPLHRYRRPFPPQMSRQPRTSLSLPTRSRLQGVPARLRAAGHPPLRIEAGRRPRKRRRTRVKRNTRNVRGNGRGAASGGVRQEAATRSASEASTRGRRPGGRRRTRGLSRGTGRSAAVRRTSGPIPGNAMGKRARVKGTTGRGGDGKAGRSASPATAVIARRRTSTIPG